MLSRHSNSIKGEGLTMSYDNINKNLRHLNKTLGDLKKGYRLQNRLQKRQGAITLLNMVSADMRRNHASEHSIRIALKGHWEYMRIVSGVMLAKSDLSQLTNPEQTAHQDIEEIPGTFLSEIATQQLEWLWEKRIPMGKITILEGDPGMSKSLLAIHIAACVTTGLPMPDGTPGKQGSVIMIAPEDGAGDTIKPRVEAAGGDPSQVLLLNTVENLDMKDVKNVNIYERPFSLSLDLHELEKAIKLTKAILVVLDPLTAVLGHNIDSSRDQGVRVVLTPLAHLAERTNCAILIIRHLKKSTSDNLLYRGAGSIGITAAARCVLIVAYDPVDEQKRVLATTKNNLSEKATNLSYKVVQNECGVPYIQWLGENNHDVSTLVGPGINLSFARQDIIKVLQEAKSPLDAKEVAEQTGQNYKSIRMTLIRMYEAELIARPSRGKYITLNHPYMAKRTSLMNKLATMNKLTTGATVTNVTDTAGELPTNGE
jgi:RecA-family ATPase